MAETYLDLSRSLVESERPADLKAEELQEYERTLSEEASPFRQKAIQVHEKNLELLQAGVFNPWTEKSLGKLTELMPDRYARNESSSGFLSAIDSYVYRSPAQLLAPATDGAETTPGQADQKTQPTPTAAVGNGVEKHATPQ